MDITCDKCQTISSIPDAAIPDDGITFECPHCSTQLFAKLNNSEPEDLFGAPSLSLDTGIDDELDSLNTLDLDMSDNSLAVEIKELDDDDISPSMLYNSEELKNQNETLELNNNTPPSNAPPLELNNNAPIKTNKVPTFKEKKDINIPQQELPQQSIPTNTLDSYLSSRSASVQEQKSQVSPLLVIIMAFLILGGAGGYYYVFMKNKNIKKQIIMTPEIQKIISEISNDNPINYQHAINTVSNKLAEQPGHILLKATYVYIAAKYFISIEAIIKPFARDYDVYYKQVKKFTDKSDFIKKAVIFYDLSKVLSNKKEIPSSLKVGIQNLPVNSPDSLLLKSYIFYKNKDITRLKKLISSSNLNSKGMIPVYFALLKAEFAMNQSISLTSNEIKKLNPKHIHTIFYNVSYLLNYNQLDEAKKLLKQTESLKSEMNDYELTKLYLLEAKIAEAKLELKEAYSFVKIAEDLKVKNDEFFKEILNFYYRNHYNTAGISMLKNNYSKNNKDFSISKIYIKLLIRDGDFGKAGQISTDLRNKYPKKPESYYLSALLSDSLGNTSIAIDFLKKALAIDSKYQNAIVLLSQEYIKKNKLDEAKSLLENFIKDFEDNSLVKDGLALLYYQNKEYEKSLKLYNELLLQKNSDLNKSDINFRINMIKYYLKDQSEEDTLKNLYTIYKKSPNFKEIRIEIAKIEIDMKKYDASIKLLKEELKIRDNNVKANLYLGIAYYLKNDFSLAENILNKTLALDGKNDKAFYYLGKTNKKLNKLNKALNAFSNAFSYDKNNYDYLIEIARIHVQLNHEADAFNAYKKLIKIKSTFDSLYEYGSLFLKQNDNKNALKYFNASYNINPENKKLILEMGNLFFKIQDYPKALIYYKKLIKLDRKNPEALYMIGEVYRSKEQFKRAIPYYLKAIKYNPNEGRYYYQLGYMYKGMKKYKKSLRIFKTYLKKVPNSPDKAEIMDEIYDLEHM